MAGILHIIGGGMAGLAAAVDVAGSGTRVILHEAGRSCGGAPGPTMTGTLTAE